MTWTRTPPSAPGWYWLKSWQWGNYPAGRSSHDGPEHAIGVAHVWWRGDELVYHTTSEPMECWHTVNASEEYENQAKNLWWPVPIPEPREEQASEPLTFMGFPVVLDEDMEEGEWRLLPRVCEHGMHDIREAPGGGKCVKCGKEYTKI